jgi:hypothetical protein
MAWLIRGSAGHRGALCDVLQHVQYSSNTPCLQIKCSQCCIDAPAHAVLLVQVLGEIHWQHRVKHRVATVDCLFSLDTSQGKPICIAGLHYAKQTQGHQ